MLFCSVFITACSFVLFNLVMDIDQQLVHLFKCGGESVLTIDWEGHWYRPRPTSLAINVGGGTQVIPGQKCGIRPQALCSEAHRELSVGINCVILDVPFSHRATVYYTLPAISQWPDEVAITNFVEHNGLFPSRY